MRLEFFDCTGDKENPAILPEVKTKQSACADVRARFHHNDILTFDNQNVGTTLPSTTLEGEKKFTLWPGDRACIPTGWKMIIPHGYQVKIVPRSGMALKFGITVINSPGTIDSDYVKELMIILHNTSSVPYIIDDGDRIAQLEVMKNSMEDLSFHLELNPKALEYHEKSSNRRGGFGHTGS